MEDDDDVYMYKPNPQPRQTSIQDLCFQQRMMPGPADYKPNKLPKNRGEFSLVKRKMFKWNTSCSPGPAEYSPSCTKTSVEPNWPRFTIQGRREVAESRAKGTPGPGHYMTEFALDCTRKSSSSYSMARHTPGYMTLDNNGKQLLAHNCRPGREVVVGPGEHQKSSKPVVPPREELRIKRTLYKALGPVEDRLPFDPPSQPGRPPRRKKKVSQKVTREKLLEAKVLALMGDMLEHDDDDSESCEEQYLFDNPPHPHLSKRLPCPDSSRETNFHSSDHGSASTRFDLIGDGDDDDDDDARSTPLSPRSQHNTHDSSSENKENTRRRDSDSLRRSGNGRDARREQLKPWKNSAKTGIGGAEGAMTEGAGQGDGEGERGGEKEERGGERGEGAGENDMEGVREVVKGVRGEARDRRRENWDCDELSTDGKTKVGKNVEREEGKVRGAIGTGERRKQDFGERESSKRGKDNLRNKTKKRTDDPRAKHKLDYDYDEIRREIAKASSSRDRKASPRDGESDSASGASSDSSRRSRSTYASDGSIHRKHPNETEKSRREREEDQALSGSRTRDSARGGEGGSGSERSERSGGHDGGRRSGRSENSESGGEDENKGGCSGAGDYGSNDGASVCKRERSRTKRGKGTSRHDHDSGDGAGSNDGGSTDGGDGDGGAVGGLIDDGSDVEGKPDSKGNYVSGKPNHDWLLLSSRSLSDIEVHKETSRVPGGDRETSGDDSDLTTPSRLKQRNLLKQGLKRGGTRKPQPPPSQKIGVGVKSTGSQAVRQSRRKEEDGKLRLGGGGGARVSRGASSGVPQRNAGLRGSAGGARGDSGSGADASGVRGQCKGPPRSSEKKLRDVRCVGRVKSPHRKRKLLKKGSKRSSARHSHVASDSRDALSDDGMGGIGAEYLMAGSLPGRSSDDEADKPLPRHLVLDYRRLRKVLTSEVRRPNIQPNLGTLSFKEKNLGWFKEVGVYDYRQQKHPLISQVKAKKKGGAGAATAKKLLCAGVRPHTSQGLVGAALSEALPPTSRKVRVMDIWRDILDKDRG
eukprot:Rmarinus@m.29202